MANPTIEFLGTESNTIIMQSSTNFDGTAQTSDPDLGGGIATFPVQVGGGLFNFHKRSAVAIENITFKGYVLSPAGVLTIKRVVNGTEIIIGTITNEGLFSSKIILAPGESLKFVSSGATNPVLAITARYVNSAGL